MSGQKVDRPIVTEADREFCTAMGAWQDANLQAYRSFHFTLQSILIAIGVGLFVFIISASFLTQQILAFIMLILLGGAGIQFLHFMWRVLRKWQRVVDYWDRLIALSEEDKPPLARLYIGHKLYNIRQAANPSKIPTLFSAIDELQNAKLESLHGKGFVRPVLDDHLFTSLRFLWFALTILSEVYLILVIFFRGFQL